MRSLQGDPPACHQGQGAARGGLQPGPPLVYTVAKQDTYIHTNLKKKNAVIKMWIKICQKRTFDCPKCFISLLHAATGTTTNIYFNMKRVDPTNKIRTIF